VSTGDGLENEVVYKGSTVAYDHLVGRRKRYSSVVSDHAIRCSNKAYVIVLFETSLVGYFFKRQVVAEVSAILR
jgi:hypothetical protein